VEHIPKKSSISSEKCKIIHICCKLKNSELKNANLNISVEGTGTVVSQDPPKGSSVDAGTVVKVTLKQL